MLFRPGSLPNQPKFKTNKALLLIDLQNDFTSPAGRLNVPNTAEFISKLPPLIEKFREDGLVVWSQTTYRTPVTSRGAAVLTQLPRKSSVTSHSADVDPSSQAESSQIDTSRLPAKPRRNDEAFLAAVIPTSSRCCIPLSVGAQVADQLAASINSEKDLISNKSGYSALNDMSLSMQLRARMVTELYICGSLSNIGVYATVYDAVQQGFAVKLIEDCLGYRDQSLHHETMTRMADHLCAEGTDYQELMDDLHGLLGDVIPGTQFTQEYEVSLSAQGPPSRRATPSTPIDHTEKVSKWMDEMNQRPSKLERPSKDATRRHSSFLASDVRSLDEDHDSSEAVQKSRASPRSSPARKRSTSDRDSVIQSLQPSSAAEHIIDESTNKTRSEVPNSKKSKLEQSEPGIEAEEDLSLHKYTSPTQYLGQHNSTSHVPTQTSITPVDVRSMSQPIVSALPPQRSPSTTKSQQSHNSSFPSESKLKQAYPQPLPSDPTQSQPRPNKSPRKKPNKYLPTYLSPSDSIGDGDSHLIQTVLPPSDADSFFYTLKSSTLWQKMYHRTGAVPRLVVVQGTTISNAIPIYRHPADEFPPLHNFDPTVTTLRKYCESIVHHPLNHVLIQYYRSSEDNISEHSDKTLDIVRGSSIVNLSLGAMRTMTLRTKKAAPWSTPPSSAPPSTVTIPAQSVEIPEKDNERKSQRIQLPHNSVFVLGQKTNANWLHAIRADKRLESEKTEEELAFECERISLTFRHIGTFWDEREGVIWGHGATGKTRDEAKKVLEGEEAERVKEEIIIGFGKENHLGEKDFDWDGIYGGGFDVVNFEVKENLAEG